MEPLRIVLQLQNYPDSVIYGEDILFGCNRLRKVELVITLEK